ncbi:MULTISPECIES: hypothetical protein [Chromobacterium]|uniref:Uncharacterized protein n=1 Tax=Chromobacterium haemolyticum TaxID=394935 RepID=A0ABS3GT96_9NEIS|nr:MULTISPECIES: hypothetical protein [Chromobacterium]MBK0417145.1 hypothetical protein [Chromobacterium haemolyticum]MBO0418271.1 hypothetical protein [Chromobacterium haemolyticum]MBO0501596.1 hypothetical protein [Chromobacterium haemolyticum]MDH0343976.1 hypothetical protein [Chromobacterium haemolyticum]QOD84334.1 hypothetical protein IEZ30_07625 [Chromobacterium haemolyticum]
MLLIVLLGWLYVVLMLAVAQHSVLASLSILFFLGVLPTFFVARMTRRKLRRQREKAREARDEA